MTTYSIHTPDTAPEQSKAVLRNVQATLGGIPNLAAAMAESPTLVKSFFTVREIYSAGTLSDADIQILSITNARENNCEWCVAFHTMLARKSGVPDETIAALRSNNAPSEPRARALSEFTSELIRTRGQVSAATVDAFRKSTGFAPGQVLEVVLGVAFSTMANYAQHIVNAPVDAMITEFEWSAPKV